MPNTLGLYNPVFYANEALVQLEKSLGMAGRIYRGYEAERNSFNRGDTINIRRPGTFTAQDAPSVAQDILPDTVQLNLNFWKEVKITLTDRELAFTGQQIIDEHIRPAAVALADDIDQRLALLYRDVPHYFTTNGAPGSAVTDLTGPRKVMFDNRVPLNDPSMMHYMVDSTMEQNLLSNTAFAQWQGAGDRGVATQQTGALGQRYGFNFFANQNVQTHTTTAVTIAGGAVNGAFAKGATSINIDGSTLTGTLVPGDVIQVGGLSYAVTNSVTASGNAMNSVGISPPLRAAVADNAAITVVQAAVDGPQRLAFHRNAFALAVAPLPQIGNELGARVATITDPITGLSIRSRLFYVGDSSRVVVALDILYGLRTLDPDLAVRAVI